MAGIPRGRLLLYLAFGFLVATLGVAGLLRARGGDPGDPSGEEVLFLEESGPAEGLSTGAPADGTAAAQAGVSPEATTTTGVVYVQVAGAVRRPGVYSLPAGSRVFEAVERAGGPTADGAPDLLPLAAVLEDGARVAVPKATEGGGGPAGGDGPGATPESFGLSGGGVPGGTTGGAAGGSGASRISLNSASSEELQTLPGIGPKTAAEIVAYREKEGPFRSVEDLDLVPGIGPATMERLRDLVQL